MNVRLLSVFTIFVLTACVSVLPEPEVPNGLYRLGDVDERSSISRTLIIREPEGARIYSGKPMVAVGDDGALRLIKGAEWAQPASQMLQVGLLDSFGTDGGGLALAKATGAPGDLELAWRISDFTVSGMVANCELELTLLDGRNRKPLAQKIIEAQAVSSSGTAAARAVALVAAAEDCVHQSAEAISLIETNLHSEN